MSRSESRGCIRTVAPGRTIRSSARRGGATSGSYTGASRRAGLPSSTAGACPGRRVTTGRRRAESGARVPTARRGPSGRARSTTLVGRQPARTAAPGAPFAFQTRLPRPTAERAERAERAGGRSVSAWSSGRVPSGAEVTGAHKAERHACVGVGEQDRARRRAMAGVGERSALRSLLVRARRLPVATGDDRGDTSTSRRIPVRRSTRAARARDGAGGRPWIRRHARDEGRVRGGPRRAECPCRTAELQGGHQADVRRPRDDDRRGPPARGGSRARGSS